MTDGRVERPSKDQISRAKALRRRATNAENLIWFHLRSRQLSGIKFRRQHPLGPYIVDFYCAGKKLVIELNGSQHFLPEEAERDAARTQYLESLGLKVLRFTNTQVLQEMDSVAAVILDAIEPSPYPLPARERNI